MDIITYALSKKYTDQTVVGGGAIKGKNCTVDSIVPIAGGNRVTFRWTLDDGTILTDYVDVMDGEKGDKGDKGDQGDIGFTGPKGDTGAQGIQGIQGPAGVKGDKGDTGNTGATGADGEAATIRIGNVTSGISPSIVNSGTAQDAVFDFILPKGDKGDQGEKGEDGADGKSFDIKAQYPNEAALRAAHPTGEAGDAYFVGTDENPDLYVWLTEDNDWFNNGKLAGVKGDKGDKGDKGFSPIAQVTKVGKVATISIRDEVGTTTATVSDGNEGSDGKSAYEVAVDEGFVGTEAEWLASLVGPQGVQGIQGPQGIQGIQGETGIGVPDSGAQGQVLAKKSGINYDTEWRTLGTAAEKNATSFVRPDNHDLVDSNAVYQAINNALSSIYTPHGEIACEDLVPALLIAENVGNIYETSDNGVTTEYFINGSGKTIAQGDSIGIVQAGPNTYLFNLMAGKIDLSEYQKKELDTAIGSATTVEDALGALNTNKQSKILTTAVEGETTVENALSALSTNKATQAEVNDIVNVLGAKNLLPFDFSHMKKINGGGTWTNDVYTYKGITYTANSDGTFTVNGTATDYSLFRIIDTNSIFLNPNNDYYITGSPVSSTASTYYVYYSELINGSWVYYSNLGNEDTLFTPNASATQVVVDIVVRNGQTASNQIFKPMIRLAADPDNTYVPYAETNRQLTIDKMSYADNGILGAKNLVKNELTLTTKNGVTYTPNNDGTFIVNGTATAGSGIPLNANIDKYLIEGMRYKISLDGIGADKDGSQNGIMMYVCKILNGVNVGDIARSNKTGGFTDEFVYHKDSSFDNLYVGCYTFNNASFTNSTIKPMIRLATDPDSTYQPYAMTNKQLTDLNIANYYTTGTYVFGKVAFFHMLLGQQARTAGEVIATGLPSPISNITLYGYVYVDGTVPTPLPRWYMQDNKVMLKDSIPAGLYGVITFMYLTK